MKNGHTDIQTGRDMKNLKQQDYLKVFPAFAEYQCYNQVSWYFVASNLKQSMGCKII